MRALEPRRTADDLKLHLHSWSMQHNEWVAGALPKKGGVVFVFVEDPFSQHARELYTSLRRTTAIGLEIKMRAAVPSEVIEVGDPLMPIPWWRGIVRWLIRRLGGVPSENVRIHLLDPI